MSKYLITLTPTNRFFFGGDMKFTVNEKATEFTSYIIQSNKFPQQTSLLGMLRFLLLSNDTTAFDKSKQEITDKTKATELIGGNSFNPKTNNKFGKIKNMSPCFLQKQCGSHWQNIQTAPADYGMNVRFNDTVTASINGQQVEIPQMNYNPKEYREPVYLCAGNCEIKESEIFQKDIRNGINRDIKTGQVKENALFKQVFYRLNEGYRFAFEADVEDLSEPTEEHKDITAYNEQLVQVGADGSMFIIGIEKEENKQNENIEVQEIYEEQENVNGIIVVLLSPSLIKAEDLKSVRFAVTQTIPFKCIQTDVEKTTSYNREKEERHSNKYNLYDTGSVFYFKTNEECISFVKKLKQQEAFYNIGYNHYQIINK
ncbi:MAG TPA: hypothetical protein GXZ87_08495 [Bacteroidales bacterium]|nr:hypothetical protein [Bacteroidales bacterium]